MTRTGEDEYTFRAKWLYHAVGSIAGRVDGYCKSISITATTRLRSIIPAIRESDQPGVDSQHSTGVSIRAHYLPNDNLGFTAIATYAKSIIKYSYDGDWGNPVLWAPVATVYQYSEIQNRDRTTRTLEFRLGTESNQGFGWLAGLYGNLLDETLSDLSLGNYQPLGLPPDPCQRPERDSIINSGYRARNLAAYGELDGDFAPDLRWSVGLRGERWSANYQGTTTDFLGTNTGYTYGPVTPTAILSVTPAMLSPTNNFWGGHASLTYKFDSSQSIYATVSRGYKAGGFNLSQGLLPNQLSFNPESDVNLETGYKADFLEHRLKVNADMFYL